MNKNKISTVFIDTLVMSNVYLQGLSGDYDGDQVSVKGVFSQEANAEADQLMKEKFHIINIYGDNVRTSTNEAVHALYLLTRDE